MSIGVDLPLTIDVGVERNESAVDVGSRRVRQVIVRSTKAPEPVHGAWLFAMAVTLAGAVALLFLVQTSAVARLGYNLSHVQREIDAQSVRNQELTYQLGYYEALPMIERIARDQLNMQPMVSWLYLDVPSPATSELATPAVAPAVKRSPVRRALDSLLGHAEAQSTPGVAP